MDYDSARTANGQRIWRTDPRQPTPKQKLRKAVAKLGAGPRQMELSESATVADLNETNESAKEKPK